MSLAREKEVLVRAPFETSAAVSSSRPVSQDRRVLGKDIASPFVRTFSSRSFFSPADIKEAAEPNCRRENGDDVL